MKPSSVIMMIAAALLLIAGDAMAATPGKGKGENTVGRKVYEAVCSVCHAKGLYNAPLLDDKQAWKARIAKGMATLEKSALVGSGMMPPKGGKAQLTDEEVKAAVAYMVEMNR